MAKGKHAAALFEVIHSDKRFGRSINASEALRTPKWWFKGRPKPSGAQSGADGSSTNADGTTRTANEPAGSLRGVSVAGVPSGHGAGFNVDRDRQQISFRISYTFAAIAGFALIVVVVLAYMVGTRLNRGPSSVSASPDIAQLQREPAQPSVMDVPSASADEGASSASATGASRASAVDGPAAQNSAPQPPPALVAQGAQRQNNLNYVVIQSYPDQADAEEAKALLADNGISATIERGLRGLHPDWYIVVGTDGFSSISSPDYTRYIQRVTRLSDQTYSRKRSFKAFQPMGYKWDRAGR